MTSPIRKEAKARKPLKVGKPRLQMNIQRLPAIAGGHKFEYKITIIHMATRVKYSEIHPRMNSQIVAETVERAVGHMPPFFLIWTDNGWEFTLKYTKYRDSKKGELDQLLYKWGFIHALVPKGSPWLNGIVERSLRTDNDNLFHRFKFLDSEDRRCQLWLWERFYNFNRPHQGIGGKKPMEKFAEMFPLHAHARMLT